MGKQHPKRERKDEQAKNKAREEKLLEKLPDQSQPGVERGERLTTGKTIARGGHPKHEDKPS